MRDNGGETDRGRDENGNGGTGGGNGNGNGNGPPERWRELREIEQEIEYLGRNQNNIPLPRFLNELDEKREKLEELKARSDFSNQEEKKYRELINMIEELREGSAAGVGA